MREGSPDHPHRDVPSVIDAFCLHVKLSPCLSLFAASPNLATSRPRHGVFACLLIVPEGLGDESPRKMSAFGSRLFHENFNQFHPLLPPQKVIFLFCLAWPLSRGLPFEHSSSKKGHPRHVSCPMQLLTARTVVSLKCLRFSLIFVFSNTRHSPLRPCKMSDQ